MRLSIMPLLIKFASQFAAHPHHHQRQVRRPHRISNTRATQPVTKPALKPAPKGKHVQLSKMKRKVGKASIPHLLMCSSYMRTMQNFADTSCFSAMFVRIVLGVGNRQVFCV